jgi:acyl-coenzyme A thioesterase PaaI-like protein
VASALEDKSHYLAKMAINLTRGDGEGTIIGDAPVRPELFAPGTTWARAGVLTTMVDLVSGHVPDGPHGPTVDMRLRIVAPPPTSGRIRLVARPLRIGRRLIVSETALSAGPDATPFAWATSTFINNVVADFMEDHQPEAPPMDEVSFDDFLGATVRDESTLELVPNPRIDNGIQLTVQGGAQALLAELAAAHRLGPDEPLVATDLDIRFLDRLYVGPLAARADAVDSHDGVPRAHVTLFDAGKDDRVVSVVTVSMTRAGSLRSAVTFW